MKNKVTLSNQELENIWSALVIFRDYLKPKKEPLAKREVKELIEKVRKSIKRPVL